MGKLPDPRRERAIKMRLQGFSRTQICKELGFKTGGRTLGEWLRGVPPPEWTKRPRAKDGYRAQAVELRKQGLSYNQITKIVPVSKSTLSLWLKDVGLTEEHRLALKKAEYRCGPAPFG